MADDWSTPEHSYPDLRPSLFNKSITSSGIRTLAGPLAPALIFISSMTFLSWSDFSKRSSIPAITHVDYSARIQTVHEETNKKYYDLLSEFKKLTNCPVLVNTSFNVRGEPIVCSVEDAFNCFMGTNLDILSIGNFLLYKEDQNQSLIKDYKNEFELD